MKTKYLLIAGVASCVSAQVFAQESATSADTGNARLGEIVVVAQKRAENLQDVPIAVAAVSSAQLKAAGIVSTQALSNSVAGLTVYVSSNYFAPTLRGVGSSFFGPGVENPVGLYVDGVYYGSQLMAPTNLSNVSQVAVLKGPQGTLFGRNSTGGVIQMTTREPEAEFGGELSTEIDNYLTSRNFVYVTGGLTEGLKTNLSLTYTKQGEGWGKNLFTGNDIHKIYHDFGVRNKWQLDAGAFTAKLNLDYSDRRDSLGANNRPAIGLEQNLHGLAANPVNYPAYLTGPNYNGPNYTSSNPYDSAVNIDNRNRFKGGGAGLTLEYDLGLAKLVSITGFRKLKYRSVSDTDASTDISNDVDINQRSRQFSQELQLVSPDNPDFNWVVGAYYYDSKEKFVPSTQSFGFFGPLFGSPDSPAYLGAGPDPLDPDSLADMLNVGRVESVANLSLRTKSIAGFAQATVRLFDETRLTGGIRLTHERRTMTGALTANIINYDGSAATNPIVIGILSDGQAGVVDTPAIKKTTPTWRVSLDHKFAPGVLGYVSYNRGYKSGGHNSLDPLGNGPIYKPEKVDAYEVGFKMELLDRTLRFNPAFFYNKYKDLQLLNLNSVLATVRNARRSRLYGIDIEAEWQATSRLNFSFGAEWLNAKFTSFPDFNYVVPLPGGGVVSGEFIGPRDAKGNYLTNAPKFVLNVGANYTVDVRDAKVTFNVNNTYNDGYYFEADNNVRQKSFNLLNASVTWVSPDEHVSVGFWGRNLLDKAIPTQVVSVPDPASGGSSGDYTNPPRTYGATLGYKF